MVSGLARAGLVLGVLLTLVALLTGCERTVAPPLVEVTELAPKEIEPGDRLEIHGTGFPQGRAGHLVLEGTAYRPGEAPQTHLTVEADGVVAAPDRMEVVVRESFAERLCGHGDRAAHATFKGDVLVSFASNDPTAPPLVGRLKNASLDVQPSSVRATVLDARTAEGTRLLGFLGITPGTASPRGIPVEKVEPGSLAERAQIQTGDIVSAVDGVHVLALADIAPASARTAELTIRHGESGIEDTKTVSLLDYSGERVPREYAPALLIVGLALAVLVLLVLPGPSALAGLELRIATHVRKTSWPEMLRGLVGNPAIAVLATALLIAFALTPWIIGKEVDGVALFALASVLFIGARVAKARGAVETLKTGFDAFCLVVVIAAALALAVAQVGAIELSEIVRLQGKLPWQLEATRHPACAVLAVVYFASIVTLLRTRSETERRLEHAAVLFACGLGVAIFLGGWQLGGAAGFALKTWLLTAICLGARKVTTKMDRSLTRRLLLRRLLPGLAVAAALVAISRRIVPNLAVETAIGATLVALIGLFLLRVAVRVRYAIGRPEPHASPFI
jgi:NADH-quinone oxidoreductase subunit H